MAEAMGRSARCWRARLAAGAWGEDQGAENAPRDLAGGTGEPRRDALDLPVRSGAWPADADAGYAESRGTWTRRDAGRLLLTFRRAVSRSLPQGTPTRT